MTTTLITGANKGLGRETARRLVAAGHTVYVGARDPERGAAAADALGARFVQLDVTDDASVAAAVATVEAGGGLDVLVNNAGIEVRSPQGTIIGAADLTADVTREVFETNVFGLVRVTHAFLPLLDRSPAPVMVNISSGTASLTRAGKSYPGAAYSASKTAVNMLTVQYAKAFPRMRINAVEPGYTATDLNQHEGTQSVEQGADIIVRMAQLPPRRPHRRLLRRHRPRPLVALPELVTQLVQMPRLGHDARLDGPPTVAADDPQGAQDGQVAGEPQQFVLLLGGDPGGHPVDGVAGREAEFSEQGGGAAADFPGFGEGGAARDVGGVVGAHQLGRFTVVGEQLAPQEGCSGLVEAEGGGDLRRWADLGDLQEVDAALPAPGDGVGQPRVRFAGCGGPVEVRRADRFLPVLAHGDRGPGPPDDQALVLEQVQRLLHGGVGRLEPVLQPLRRGQGLARGEVAGQDLVAQVRGDTCVERAAVGGRFLGSGHRQSILMS